MDNGKGISPLAPVYATDLFLYYYTCNIYFKYNKDNSLLGSNRTTKYFILNKNKL